MNDERQKLMEDNINLVYYIVHRDYPTYSNDEDVIQSGMLGLCKAADTWKEEGLFSTYASKCIRNEIHNEFTKRKPLSKVISLESKVGEDGTLEDVLAGDEDVQYVDDMFYNQLSEEEQRVLDLDSAGFNTVEIGVLTDYDQSKIQKILRLIKLKWRAFNED